MKNLSLLLLSIAFALNIQTVSAGDDDKHESKIGGIRAGWQYSGIYDNGSLPTGYDPLSAFYVGLFKEVKVIPLFRVGGGLEYSQVGIVSNVQNIDNSIKLQYLYIPIYAKLKLGPVFILGGISPSFKVAEKVVALGQEQDISSDNKANGFDVPVFLGAGLKILFISIEARYNWGTIDVYDSSKNQYFQVGAAVSF